MLTRLRVSGFKNLVDVDVRFGPFTCIAGPNGIGKSNLFDAIRFLSLLAEKPILEAASSIRGDRGSSTHPESLFYCAGEKRAPTMSFDVEMIVPHKGEDQLGQPADAAKTFLRYGLTLALGDDTISIQREELTYIREADTKRALGFPYSMKWRRSVVAALQVAFKAQQLGR